MIAFMSVFSLFMGAGILALYLNYIAAWYLLIECTIFFATSIILVILSFFKSMTGIVWIVERTVKQEEGSGLT